MGYWGYGIQALIELGEAVECLFVERLNRFVGLAICGGREERIHINNTGRLLDLLFKGSRILCTPIVGKKVSKRVVGTHVEGESWTLIDTKLQERAFVESIRMGLIGWLEGYRISRRDFEVSGARIDFLLEGPKGPALVELKSAVFYHQHDRSARYPDTVSMRGRRHVEILASVEGYERFAVFIAGHPKAVLFGPSSVDPLLPGILRRAVDFGVRVKALKLYIEGLRVVLSDPDLPVTLDPPGAGNAFDS